MKSRAGILACAVFALAAIACGGRGGKPDPKVAEAERARTALADARTLAPQAYAEADQALRAAREADAAGDKEAASLHAERALAAYQHAVAIARLARATDEELRAKEALGHASEQLTRFSIARSAAEREADDFDRQLKIAREAQLPAPSGPADPERERARLVAAGSLAVQARLLCSAARLVSAQAAGLAEAEAAVADVEKRVDERKKPAPIDAAGRARATCLSVLTKARRAGAADAEKADELLGELSRAKLADASPSRDERGVVVTLRSTFRGDALAPEAENRLKELGRVAAANPGFALQVVVHDGATSPSREQNKRRGDAALSALKSGGASKMTLEQAGARAPLYDPADAKRRGQNARLEIVFVGSGS
jgi:hypothetical protein